MLSGCIPVFFFDAPTYEHNLHFFWEWKANASLNFPPSAHEAAGFDVVRELRAVPAAQVGAMQGAIRRRAHSLVYPPVGEAPLAGSAPDLALRALRLTRGEGAASRGHRTVSRKDRTGRWRNVRVGA